MKKILALLLVLCLFVPSALAFEELPGYWKPPVANEGQYPIEGGYTLKYWMPINSGAANFIASYEENISYQKIQENTGVDIEFIHPAVGTEAESLRLMIASGDLPDMILMSTQTWYDGGLRKLYDDGAIIDLTPYLEQYAPQYKYCVDYSDLCKRQAIDQGQYLGFFKMTYADKMPYIRFNTNKDWLTEAGFESEPVTLEEYETYLDWIVNNKPEVSMPLFLGSFSNTSAMTNNLIMGCFDMLYDWYVDKEDPTKVRTWAMGENYKAFLTKMNEWYNKGYLGKDFLSLTMSEAQAMFDAGKIGMIADSVDATYSRVKDYMNLTNLPYMRPTQDYVLGSGLANTPIGDGGEWVTVITSSCKNVEAAVQYLNYGYTYEGAKLFTFGVEDVCWSWNEEGRPVYTDLMVNNPQGMTLSNISYAIKIHFGAKYCFPDDLGPTMTPEVLRIRTMWSSIIDHEQNYLQMPPITLTTEENEKRNELWSEISSYAKEMMIKFITGDESIDNFEAYENELKDMGIEEAISITQDALNRYLAK